MVIDEEDRIYADEVNLFHDRRWNTVIYYVRHNDGRELYSSYTVEECDKWVNENVYVREGE